MGLLGACGRNKAPWTLHPELKQALHITKQLTPSPFSPQHIHTHTHIFPFPFYLYSCAYRPTIQLCSLRFCHFLAAQLVPCCYLLLTSSGLPTVSSRLCSGHSVTHRPLGPMLWVSREAVRTVHVLARNKKTTVFSQPKLFFLILSTLKRGEEDWYKDDREGKVLL